METFEPTLREFSGEDSNSSDPASVDDRTKLAEGAPGSASDLLGPPAANRHRLQMSVRPSHIISPSGDMKAI
jgi:hypothetical protein